MRTAEDAEGRRYVVLKRSQDATLVADPASGERRYLPNERVELTDGDPVDPRAACWA